MSISEKAGMSHHIIWRLLPLCIPLLLLMAWIIMVKLEIVPVYALPSPQQVVRALWSMVSSAEFVEHASISLQRLAIGFGSGALAGSVLGIIVGSTLLAHRMVDPFVQALRTVPIIAWIPLFILWMGVGELPKVTLIALGAFFPVYLNLSNGIARLDRKLSEVAYVNRIHGWRFLAYIAVPATLPSYFIGLRTGMGLSWMFLAAAEIMGASSGIGYLLLEGQTVGKPEIVIACALVFSLCGKASDEVLSVLARRLLDWQDVASAR